MTWASPVASIRQLDAAAKTKTGSRFIVMLLSARSVLFLHGRLDGVLAGQGCAHPNASRQAKDEKEFAKPGRSGHALLPCREVRNRRGGVTPGTASHPSATPSPGPSGTNSRSTP